MFKECKKLYRVVHLPTGAVVDLNEADEVGNALWGMWPITDYAIYKRNIRWTRRSGGDIVRWVKALDDWEPRIEEIEALNNA